MHRVEKKMELDFKSFNWFLVKAYKLRMGFSRASFSIIEKNEKYKFTYASASEKYFMREFFIGHSFDEIRSTKHERH